MTWRVETLNDTVDREFDALPADTRARFTRTGGVAMTKVAELHERWSQDADYRNEYERFGPEFEVARALIKARTRAGFTQAELAARMKTTQSAVARMESGRVPPSMRTLEKVAQATGTRLRIRFEQG